MKKNPQNLSDWLQLIEQTHSHSIALGLERLRLVAERLDFSCELSFNPMVNLRDSGIDSQELIENNKSTESLESLESVDNFGKKTANPLLVTIAGTNGKGTCVATLSALAEAQGLRVGTYTSPHFFHFNERICIDKKPVSDVVICQAFASIEAVRNEVPLTFFEYSTLAAFIIFDQAELDIWILEVGLGGRLDAVNLLNPDISVITSIGLDHQAWLGNDLDSIGREKAGILRRNRPVVLVPELMPSSVIQCIQQKGSNLLPVNLQMLDNGAWRIRQQEYTSDCFEPVSVSCALEVAYFLQWNTALKQGKSIVSQLQLTGRRQSLYIRGRWWLFDVAHNPAASATLVTWWQSQNIIFTRGIFSALEDKDINAMLLDLVSLCQHWLFFPLSESRGSSIDQLKSIASNLSETSDIEKEFLSSTEETVETCIDQTEENNWILVCGSFYTVAQVMNYLSQDYNAV